MDVRCKIERIEMYLLNSFQWPPYPMASVYGNHVYNGTLLGLTKIKIKHDLVAPACNNCYED